MFAGIVVHNPAITNLAFKELNGELTTYICGLFALLKSGSIHRTCSKKAHFEFRTNGKGLTQLSLPSNMFNPEIDVSIR